jgi:ankyrin repeat protein
MPFGEVVRQLRRMNAANFGSLAACRKDLRAVGAPHGRTYQLLQARLFVTMPGAVSYTEKLAGDQTLAYAQKVLDALEGRNRWGVTNLMRAANRNALVEVKALLHHGVDLNVQDWEERQSALMRAADGHHNVVHLLIQAGTRLNDVCKYGNTALFYATKKAQINCMQPLIEARADVNVRNIGGVPILMIAASSQSSQRATITQMLLDAKAEVNTQSLHGETALSLATACGYQDVVKQLLAAGAEPLRGVKANVISRT